MTDIQDLLIAGVELLALGMGSVFLFLVMLVGVMGLMARLVARIERDGMATAQAPGITATLDSPRPDTEMVAVISAAVARYRMARGTATGSKSERG